MGEEGSVLFPSIYCIKVGPCDWYLPMECKQTWNWTLEDGVVQFGVYDPPYTPISHRAVVRYLDLEYLERMLKS